MTLDDWIHLSSQERAERLRERRWNSGEGWSIIFEAAERFRREFGGRPEILNISPVGVHDENEPRMYIAVRTRLPHGQEMADLPPKYLTFPVEQEALRDDVAAFKDTWRAVLERIFGWDSSKIQKFIDEQEWVFHSSWFLHDIPLEFLPGPTLAYSLLGNRSEQELKRIGHEMLPAIEADGRITDHFYLHDDPDFDWGAAKRRVEAVVAQYR